ncbi:recombinase family protein [Frankia sp. CgMI4]|uniref:recombinase family protein n=1 Tax=unclassified Frankia TaxID=2632575 RepID=UPI00097633A0
MAHGQSGNLRQSRPGPNRRRASSLTSGGRAAAPSATVRAGRSRTSTTDKDVGAHSGRPRPEWDRLVDDIKAGRLQAIVCWHIDRLTRQPREVAGRRRAALRVRLARRWSGAGVAKLVEMLDLGAERIPGQDRVERRGVDVPRR